MGEGEGPIKGPLDVVFFFFSFSKTRIIRDGISVKSPPICQMVKGI